MKENLKRLFVISFCAIIAFNAIFAGREIEIQAEVEMITIYFIDKTAEKWIENDSATMVLVDNTNGHDAYNMTLNGEYTWSVEVPATANNITFNRYDARKTIQWNSWSAGGRDGKTIYLAEGSEYGKWIEEENYGFKEGDILYLDLSNFKAWIDQEDTTRLYANFTSATKQENSGNDITINSANNSLYDPYSGLVKVNDYIYTYTITSKNAGKEKMRFWRGNKETLWNCSNVLSYSDFSFGKNCVKVLGWSDNGELTTYNFKEKVELSFDLSKYEYIEESNSYVVNEKIDQLTGRLQYNNLIKSMSCKISDINGDVICKENIEVEENWKLDNLGLVVGMNYISVVVISVTGKEFKFSVNILNSNLENMDSANVDLSDTDKDGIIDYFEGVYGSDKNLVDTDNDGLNDYLEIIEIGTSPIKEDTNDDGVLDGNEDFDDDGLDTLEEVKNKTQYFGSDTDGDGLNDGEEVNKWGTDPLVADTDCDKLKDAQDVVLGFDPCKADTNENEILDGDEIIYQTCEEELSNKELPGITNVSVSLECSGYIDDEVCIMDTYDLDMRSSEVVGIKGSPINISTDVEFDTAEITFSYNEEELGETKPENLCIMWYDEDNDNYVMLDDTVLNKQQHTLSYTTTHFSTYLVVDKEIWLDNMREDLNYRKSGKVKYYDMALVVDTSGSMSGTRMQTAKTALNSFVSAMLEGDRAGLVKFESLATTLQSLTGDTTILTSKINSLCADGGTDANAGIQAGIKLFDEEASNERMLVLICDGDIYYTASIIEEAIEKEIKIHCINVSSGNSTVMEKIASETGGNYYYAATSSDIAAEISKLKGETITYVDSTDTDGDGLYDVYEVNGMRLSNGQVVYTDPEKSDSDGDGVSDYDAMGGAPIIEEYTIDGNIYSCTLNHSNVYGKLSKSFIYVDGTLNSDGSRIFDKMDYIPYSNAFLQDKYAEPYDVEMKIFNETRQVLGAARVHKSFVDRVSDVSEERVLYYSQVVTFGTIAVAISTFQGAECYLDFVLGVGGSEPALVSYSTRKYINASYMIEPDKFINSGYDYYQDNMKTAFEAAKSVLNKFNTDVYIALSPDTTWRGLAYNDTDGFDDMYENMDTIYNIPAFGIFNNADAAITLHCSYNPDNQEYTLEYIYYIIDYYDFSFYSVLEEMDALGLAKSYELYGICKGNDTRKKDDTTSFRF